MPQAPSPKPSRQLIAYALAAAIATTAGIVPFLHAQNLNLTVTGNNNVIADPAPISAPSAAAAPGEPGEAPRPRPASTSPAKPDDPGGLMESGAQVYVDDSFAAVDQLRQAIRQAGLGQSEIAIANFQKIVNEYGRKLVYLNNGSYVSITDFIRERFLAMPAVKEGMYDQLFGSEARKEIETPVQQHDLAALIRVCDRYFPSTAALNGLSQAAEWYFERGEFAAASRTWQLLLTHPMAVNQRPLFLFRAAVADSLGGNHIQAQNLRGRLLVQFPDAVGLVDGKESKLLPALDDLLAVPPLAATTLAPDEWPAFQGGPTHSQLQSVNSSIDARLWSVALDDEAITGLKKVAEGNPSQPTVRVFRGGMPQPNDPNYQALNSYPILSHNTLFVHTGQRIAALSINAGTLLWAYPQRPIVRTGNEQPDYGMPFHPSYHDSVAVVDDQVFATLPAAEVRGFAARPNMYGMPPGGNTCVTCLNRQSGALLWSTSAHGLKLEKPGALSFIGSPVVTRQGVFTMARKTGDGTFSENYLVRLDRDSGVVSWVCYICSASTAGPFGIMNATGSSIPVPTIVDDMVYISTGNGADCAIDANAGRILWLQITETARQTRNPQEMYNPQQPIVSWKMNPPVVSGDKLITCEASETASTLRIYNRWSGTLLRSITRKDLNNNAFDIFPGVIDNAAIVIGSNITAIDLDSIDKELKIAWTVDAPRLAESGKLMGRPFLAANSLYIPYEKSLLLIDPRRGKNVSFLNWPRTEKDLPARAGNLLVTSEQVIVLNDTEIAGYSKWETARDNRLARIKDRPGDPEPCFALAEVAFRTAHFDLAQQYMQRAVELANNPETPASPEFLARVYRTNLNFAEQLLVNADISTRDRARFHYDQCRLIARTPEQQAEWRLCMSKLSLAQKKPEEAALLYNEVLIDPALHNASYLRADTLAPAGVTAEQLFHHLIEQEGPAVYTRFEDQAAALLNSARANKDSAALEKVLDGYPNSASAIAAATDLAAAARNAHDYTAQLKCLRWLNAHVTGDKKAAVVADFATTYLSLPKPRYNTAISWIERGARQYKDFSWTDSATGQRLTFASLREKLRTVGPAALAQGREPTLFQSPSSNDGQPQRPPVMDEESASKSLATATLLVPVERAATLRRPDLLFIFHDGTLHIIDTPHASELTTPQTRTFDGTVKVEGGITFPAKTPAVYLGCVGDIAVFAQAKFAIGINLKSPAIAWTIPFSGEETESTSRTRGGQQAEFAARAIVIQGGANVVIDTNAMSGNPAPNINLNADPEAARQANFNQLQGRAFSTLRLINDKLIAVTADKLTAYNVASGKLAWLNSNNKSRSATLPETGVTVVLGTEDVLVAQVDTGNRSGPTFYVLDTETGKYRKQIKLEDERALWRTVSDDGILFVATDRAIAAYDLFNESSQPVWRRTDIRSRFPTASVLTLDGLIVINGESELLCLSPEGGEVRWPTQAAGPVTLPVRASAPRGNFLRSLVDGDTVIFQSPQGIVACYTYANPAQQIAWEGHFKPATPPLQSFQLSDPYVVVLASGPIEITQRAVRLVLLRQKGGKDDLDKPITRSVGDSEGPLIRAWQPADNGIALEVDGKVYFYRVKNTDAPDSPH